MLDESELSRLAVEIARELIKQRGVHFSFLAKSSDGIVLPKGKQVRVIAQVEDDKLDDSMDIH